MLQIHFEIQQCRHVQLNDDNVISYLSYMCLNVLKVHSTVSLRNETSIDSLLVVLTDCFEKDCN